MIGLSTDIGSLARQRVLFGVVVLMLLSGCASGAPLDPDVDNSPDLELDAPSLLQHGDTYNYTVEFTEWEGQVSDVTEEADVEIREDVGGVSVDSGDQMLVADEEAENRSVTVVAHYEGSTTSAQVVVAENDIQNVAILPTEWRISTVLDDGTVRTILIAIMTSVVATRWASSFAGLGALLMVLTIGWFAGWVGLGIVLVGLFSTMFIGFNLAANIDYTVRR